MSTSSSAKKPAKKRRGQDTAYYIVRSIGLSGWIIVAFFLAQAVIVALLWLLGLFGGSLAFLNDAVLNSILAAAVYAFTLVIVLGAPRLAKRPSVSMKLLGLDRLPNWKDIGLAPLALIPYFLLGAALMVATSYLVPGFEINQEQNVGFENVAQRFEYLLAFITLVVVAPIAEEVLFRGYLYGRLRERGGIIVAILLTSLVFGVLHGQLNVGVNVFALSIILCLLREVTGSIWSGILLHMIKNGIAFYVLFAAPMIQ